MTDLSLVLIGGLLGSSHCVGMCGGFAVAIGAESDGWRNNLMRQSVYGAGRLFTYSTLGAVAGFGGRKLVLATSLVNMQAVLAIAAGLLLISQGFRATTAWNAIRRHFERRRSRSSPQPVRLANSDAARRPGFRLPVCLQPGLVGSLLRRRGATGPLLAGVLTGFLPCGLVYAMLALAVSSGNLADGAVTMVCFGAGTLPLMIGLGLGTSLVGLATRRRMFQLAAWCVVLTGGLSLARGAYALSLSPLPADRQANPRCPLCESAGDSTNAHLVVPALSP